MPVSGGNLRSDLVQHLREAGVEGLPKDWFVSELRKSEVLEEQFQVPVVDEGIVMNSENIVEPGLATKGAQPIVSSVNLQPSEPISEAELQELEKVKSEAMVCTKCRLCETRTNVVFGTGNINRPLIAFIGEGPGADEDAQGVPFVGRSGQLLTAAITRGMGLRREDIYIANVVKCRPPGNRAPLPDESGSCLPYLYRQLELIQPRVLITLGQPAQMALSGVNMGITKLRGQWQNWRGFKLMPTFHPAYLLRNPPAKRFFWEDLQSVMSELGLPKPQRQEESTTKNPWPSN